MTEGPEYIRTHLAELRQRVLYSFLAILGCAALAYFYSEPISRFFMAPLFSSQHEAVKLIYTNLTEAFITYLKMALLVGIILSFPILLYQAWMFVAPGLTRKEKRITATIIFWATALFAGGIFFAYFIVLPEILSFFMGFATPELEPLPKIGGYLTFVARTCLAFGLAFEIPFLMVMAAKTGLVSRNYFSTRRKYYYPAILVLAFLLTAGEPTATILLSAPLAGLYETGILVIRAFTSRPTPEER